MFIVFNKQKIYSYLVAFSTVIVLFVIAFVATTHQSKIIATMAQVKEMPIYQVRTNEKKVALTINCIEGSNDIDSILQTLEKSKIHITFFVVGDWAEKNPEAVKKIAKAGHEIGNLSNTYAHVNQLSHDENVKEINSGAEKIEKLTGKKTILYRCPYGEYNNDVIKASKSASHLAIQWNLDTLDYTGITGTDIWNKVEAKLENGSILLMHNGTVHTADSLEMLLQNIQKKGYAIVPVSELIYQENYTIDSNGIQKQNIS